MASKSNQLLDDAGWLRALAAALSDKFNEIADADWSLWHRFLSGRAVHLDVEGQMVEVRALEPEEADSTVSAIVAGLVDGLPPCDPWAYTWVPSRTPE